MAKNRFMTLPGGRTVFQGKRFGGHEHDGHDRYSAVCRQQALSRVMDLEFSTMLDEMGMDDTALNVESTSVWTLLEPNSGFKHTRTFIIEGDYDLAVRVYAARMGGRHPEKVSCDCGCGSDYWLTTVVDTLTAAIAAVHRYNRNDDVTVIRASDITDAERAFPTPRITTPADYWEDVQALAWVFQAEL